MNQPKWRHLKQLHELLRSMEKVLTYGDVKHTGYGHLTTATTYTYQGKSSCFIGNAENGDRNITFGNRIYNIPGWSVSILLDYKSDVYNNAEELSYLIPSIVCQKWMGRSQTSSKRPRRYCQRASSRGLPLKLAQNVWGFAIDTSARREARSVGRSPVCRSWVVHNVEATAAARPAMVAARLTVGRGCWPNGRAMQRGKGQIHYIVYTPTFGIEPNKGIAHAQMRLQPDLQSKSVKLLAFQ
ncbi:unnamed protein product [Citrullus colocynthis]|uniref:Beta-galactosidase beta-sandwich domain-containing protein n=1 Tax=Citrullus colocynthis TaxID=252529 RepID=A0ABP0YHY9_9ROSI